MRRIRSVLFLGFCAFPLVFAQDNPPETPATATDTPAPPRIPITPQNGEPQPYEKVITKDAKTQKGVFTVHQIKERYFYEIPKTELDKEFLWNTQTAQTALGLGYGGSQLATHVVRWELHGNREGRQPRPDHSIVARRRLRRRRLAGHRRQPLIHGRRHRIQRASALGRHRI